jgi:excisionase family DNA binding protein
MARRQSDPFWYLKYAPSKDELALKQVREGSASSRLQKIRKVSPPERQKPKTLAEMAELLTPKQVAAYLKCSEDHVYDIVKDGALRCQPDRSRILVSVIDLYEYLQAEQVKRYG